MSDKYHILEGGQQSAGQIKFRFTHYIPKFLRTRMDGLFFITVAITVFSLALTVSMIINILVLNSQQIRTATVVSDVKNCSDMGRDTLERGGNAVDAAIVTILCMGLYSPQYSGLGGGGFMVVFQKSKDPESIDFREVAPRAAFENMFESNTSNSTKGGLSVAVPGEVRGLELASHQYGKLDWKDLFTPVIEAAENGVNVSSFLAKALIQELSSLSQNSIFLAEFTRDGHTPLQEGDIMKRPSLAKTMRLIQSQGADAFYTGDIAKEIVNYTKQHGGILDLEDMSNYSALIKPVISTMYKGYKLVSAPLPSGGPALLYCMNILNYQKFNSTPTGWDYHRIIEAFKFTFAERMKFGDPSFVNSSNLTKVVANLMKEDTGRNIYEKIDDNTYGPSHYGAIEMMRNNHGTTHISVLDSQGMGVSVTVSVNLHFGSGLITPTYGIVLNDDMDDFSSPNKSNVFGFPPSPNNFIRPGKRAQSSMAPTIVLDKGTTGREYAVHVISGASGGSFITTSIAQVLLDMLSFGMSPEDAVSMKRIHNQLIPAILYIENGFPPAAETILRSIHNGTDFIVNGTNAYSAVDAILSNVGEVSAASDPRKGGGPAYVYGYRRVL